MPELLDGASSCDDGIYLYSDFTKQPFYLIHIPV
jgi:hypothetical protein